MKTNKNIDFVLENKLIKKINELYITDRKKFLLMNKNGEYVTLNKTLHDGLIRKHLRYHHAIGVFSGKEISKFVCFDLDIIDKLKLRWVYYLLKECIMELGINQKYIYTSSSGNKGMHILVFIEHGTQLKNCIKFFNATMKLIKSKLNNDVYFEQYEGEEYYGQFEFGKIEYRCSYTQGVKIELSRNFKNKDFKNNKCLFLDENLSSINDDKFLLSIDSISKGEFLDIINEISNDETEIVKLEEESNFIKGNLTESKSHKINKDENETIEHIVNLLRNGLYIEGTRHNSVLKIAKYFRYMGMDLEDAITESQNWMKWQDRKYYDTPLDEALKECRRLTILVYEKEYSLFGHVEDIKISKSEMKEIMGIKNRNDKLLLYTMLIHSKRYSLKNGVFYMTFNQITEICGLSDKGASESIKRLEESGQLEVVSRNIKADKTNRNKPNKYRLQLNSYNIDDEIMISIDNTPNNIEFKDNYYMNIINLFSNEELKHLPRNQYYDLINYRKSMVS